MADEAARHGHTADRRITAKVYAAETREQAFDDVRWGARRFLLDYYRDTGGFPVAFGDVEPGREIEELAASGGTIVGSVEDCIAGTE